MSFSTQGTITRIYTIRTRQTTLRLNTTARPLSRRSRLLNNVLIRGGGNTFISGLISDLNLSNPTLTCVSYRNESVNIRVQCIQAVVEQVTNIFCVSYISSKRHFYNKGNTFCSNFIDSELVK